MISIIVPVYNVEKYLDECIQSIVSQSYTDWECILIDDGSTDNSGLLCDKWAKQDNRIKVIHQENQGVSAARNQGIDNSKGEFITFIDSDDWVESEYLQTLFQPTLKQPTDLIVTGIIQDYSNENSTIYQPNYSLTFELTSSNITHFVELNQKYLLYGPTSNLYRSDFVRQYQIRFCNNTSYGEDLLFNYQYLEHVRTITCVNQSHYHYRIISSGTLSSTFRANQFEIDYEQWKVLQSFYQRKGLWNQEVKNYLYNRLWGIIYDGIFLYPKLKNNNYTYLKNILSIPEIGALKYYKNVFSCKEWIKNCIIHRNCFLFSLIFTIFNMYNGEKKTIH